MKVSNVAYCARCGEPTRIEVPVDDNRPRAVCSGCGHVHYENPRVVVGAIIEHDARILLCRRAIEPRLGYWTVPAGFLEIGESVIEGARRETAEEARADIEVVGPHSHLCIPHIGQTHIHFRARFAGAPSWSPGPESSEVELVAPEDVPWDDLAFPVIRETLRLWLADRERGQLQMHHGTIVRVPGAGLGDWSAFFLTDAWSVPLSPSS